MTIEILTVPDISCDHCRATIEEAVGALPGVRAASVDIESRTVRVDYELEELDPAAIRAAIEAVGYPVPDPA